MIAVPPFRGELGILIRFHAAAVRAMPRPILVAHEAGLEALYPDVTDRRIVPPLDDDHRRWTYNHDSDFVASWKRALRKYEIRMPDKQSRHPILPFPPVPFLPQRGPGAVGPDVVVCPRMRRYGAEKNWPAWPATMDALVASGLRVFAAGSEATSYPAPKGSMVERAWDYERPLDATIEAMTAARVTIATASGLSLLSLLCGAQLLLVTSRGACVAPGPSRDLDGKVHHAHYWKVPLADYYEPLRINGSSIKVMDGSWEDPGGVVKSTVDFLGASV